jgi:nucleoid-associated protein YgaU
MGKLEKVAVTGYAKPDYTGQVGSYSLKINPASFSQQFKATYNPNKTTDTAGRVLRYVSIEPQTVSFEFYLDATGVIDGIDDVAGEIAKFRKVAYDFNGTTHSPNYLHVVWGKSLDFKCHLTSLDIEYQLFDPDGTPLRAKLKVSLVQALSAAELALSANKTSPDLTHARIAVAGDTLPLMCYRIYGDSRYYLEVARYNGLSDFRNLRPGTQVLFPPLENAS